MTTVERHELTQRQFVWGTQYIDEAIAMYRDLDSDGDLADYTDTSVNQAGGAARYRCMQDANYNVIALRNSADGASERYEYDPYGVTPILAGYNSSEGHEDLNVVAASQLAASNPIRYAGYYFDDETGLYHVRHRYLDPRLGRWMQKDPECYVDSMDLCEYVRSRPVTLQDPMGHMIYDPFGLDYMQDCCGGVRRGFRHYFKKCCGNSRNGQWYNPVTHCCNRGTVVAKVSICICERPIDGDTGWFCRWASQILPYQWEYTHEYVCCAGPKEDCYAKFPKVKQPGDPIPHEHLLTGCCTEIKVCPCVKAAKCNNPTATEPWDRWGYNCHEWAWRGCRQPPCNILAAM